MILGWATRCMGIQPWGFMRMQEVGLKYIHGHEGLPRTRRRRAARHRPLAHGDDHRLQVQATRSSGSSASAPPLLRGGKGKSLTYPVTLSGGGAPGRAEVVYGARYGVTHICGLTSLHFTSEKYTSADSRSEVRNYPQYISLCCPAPSRSALHRSFSTPWE